MENREVMEAMKKLVNKGVEKYKKIVELTIAGQDNTEARKEYGNFCKRFAAAIGTSEESINSMILDASREKENFYFTFGSSSQFPYQSCYMIVRAYDINAAARKFQMKYPNRYDSDVLNCADYYNQKRWDEIIAAGYYANEKPVEILD